MFPQCLCTWRFLLLDAGAPLPGTSYRPSRGSGASPCTTAGCSPIRLYLAWPLIAQAPAGPLPCLLTLPSHQACPVPEFPPSSLASPPLCHLSCCFSSPLRWSAHEALTSLKMHTSWQASADHERFEFTRCVFCLQRPHGLLNLSVPRLCPLLVSTSGSSQVPLCRWHVGVGDRFLEYFHSSWQPLSHSPLPLLAIYPSSHEPSWPFSLFPGNLEPKRVGVFQVSWSALHGWELGRGIFRHHRKVRSTRARRQCRQDQGSS